MAQIRIDSSNVRGLAEKLKQAKEKLQVGWMPGAKYDDGLPVAMVAAWNEFGTSRMPPRPFMRPSIADNKSKWVDVANGSALQWLNGAGSFSQVMTTLGLVVEADIKNSIVSVDKPLSPVTLALRRLKNDGVPISGALVGMVAAAVANGETGPGQLGQPFANQDPLRDTGYMLSTLTHEVTQ